MWNVYIMEVLNFSKNHPGKIEYYTGIAYSPSDNFKDIARNIIRRFHEHKAHYKSSWMNHTRKIPRRIVFVENGFKNKYQAEKREYSIKKKSHNAKADLIETFHKDYPHLSDWLDNYFYRYGRFCY